MKLTIGSSPHLRPAGSVRNLMLQVLAALLPAVAAYVWYFGWSVVLNIALAVVVATATEALLLRLRHRPVAPFVADGSAIVTAVLLALALPPLAPWWIVALGAAFAIVFGKQLFGGLGYNPFNPAMLGYVMLLIAFPRELTSWLPPGAWHDAGLGLLENLRITFLDQFPQGVTRDAITGATPLDEMRTQLRLDQTIAEIRTAPVFGTLGGAGWEWINGCLLAGGVWLLYRRVITWHIPVALLASITLIAGVFYLIDSKHYADPLFHLFSGATILGAFFIATDPVSACTTNTGRLIFAAGIGVVTYVIRTWGGYPDGIAFAVLIMNMAAPTIDHYTQPRVFGHRRG